MLTDVTQRQRPEQGIAQRVQGHITIGMSGQSFAVRNAYTAQHHVVAIGEGMHIQSLSYALLHALTPALTVVAR